MERGLIHLYTGEGKGKTTAAVGLAVRAAGNGKKVIFAQFMKGGPTGELKLLQREDNIAVVRSDKNFGFFKSMSEEQKSELTKIHNAMFKEILTQITNQKCEVLILDEITYPVMWQLIDCTTVRQLVENKPEWLEIIMTGRKPDTFMVDGADYITRMECVRHPFEKGIAARKGIEY